MFVLNIDRYRSLSKCQNRFIRNVFTHNIINVLDSSIKGISFRRKTTHKLKNMQYLSSTPSCKKITENIIKINLKQSTLVAFA